MAGDEPVLVHNECPRGIHPLATDENPCECVPGSNGAGADRGGLIRRLEGDLGKIEDALTHAGEGMPKQPPQWDLTHTNAGHGWEWAMVAAVIGKHAVPVVKNVARKVRAIFD
jgi:hypothetical protein